MNKKCDKTKCPYLGNPFPDCYCAHMNSQMTEKIVRFCGDKFEECEIYKKHYKELR